MILQVKIILRAEMKSNKIKNRSDWNLAETRKELGVPYMRILIFKNNMIGND